MSMLQVNLFIIFPLTNQAYFINHDWCLLSSRETICYMLVGSLIKGPLESYSSTQWALQKAETVMLRPWLFLQCGSAGIWTSFWHEPGYRYWWSWELKECLGGSSSYKGFFQLSRERCLHRAACFSHWKHCFWAWVI